ncbi:MAG TPA: Gfo/Idh/MocA family oxidoreductase [Ignavibacteria bacterium]|nr:Gfo/Idh/MocA family oxidoreductase [Ignavibacteria bacterium]
MADNFNGINLAIIGCGKWGMNHVKTANGVLKENFKIVCDNFASNEAKIKEVSPSVKFTTDLKKVLNNPDINAVIIATPAETHYEIGKQCLEQGKNVLIEKPITLHSNEAQELIDIAKKQNLKLMVGHVLLYHPAILKIKEMIDSGKIGKLQYIYSNRLNLGTIRSEENILWSFAPHDISVIQFFTESNPVEIFSKGATYVQDDIEDTTITYLKYPNNVNAHIFVSWLNPFKEQRLVIIGDKGMLVFEDSSNTDKLKYFEKGFQVNEEGQVEKFDKKFEVINFDESKPLEEEQKHFYNSVMNNTMPLTDGVHALKVLEILEKAQQGLKN